MNDRELLQRLRAIPAPQRAAELAQRFPGDAARQAEWLERVTAAERDEAVTTPPRPSQPAAAGHESLATLAQSPAVGSAAPRESVRDAAWIDGRYQLVEKLGEGGMGSVWIAEQHEPVRRRVAIKLIRSGLESAAIVRRFEAERQALARMDHPGIARVHDGGTTERGEPWFAMELVSGVPLTDYCDRQRVGVRTRLELFVQICQAVQHAHQKGVIHRDLKPGNILVTEVDGRPVPKVIDFGVAKAMGQPLTDQTFGDTGAIVGTPTYMSPEQADPSSGDLDTRTDVYALGVVLYELLVGAPPLDASQFERGALLEMLRMVREVDPPRPSTRLSTVGDLPAVAASRALDPAALLRWLRSDIDWIVMKAIEKEPARRYESPLHFAADIERFLAHEPVTARPPSRWYRVRKFVRRHRAAVVSAALLVLALLAGIVGTTLGMYEARAQQVLAKAAERRESERAAGEQRARQQAQESAENERLAKEQTQRRLTQIEAGSELLFSVFADLDIRQARDGEPLEQVLARRLVQAGEKIDEQAVGDASVVATLCHRLGTSLLSLGSAADAKKLLARAAALHEAKSGATHRDTIAALVNLAEALEQTGDLAAAFAMKADCWERLKTLHGAEHADALMAQANLANCHSLMGRFDLALPMLEAVWEARKRVLGVEHFDTLTSLSNLAVVCADTGQTERAIELGREAVRRLESSVGPQHPDSLLARNNLASALRDGGQASEGLAILGPAFATAREHVGADHPTTLKMMGNLGLMKWLAGEKADGERMVTECRRLAHERLGDTHPATLTALRHVAELQGLAGDFAAAVEAYRELLPKLEASLGEDHPDVDGARFGLANGLAGKREFAEAIASMETVVAFRRQRLGNHRKTFVAMTSLSGFRFEAGRRGDALSLLEEVVRLEREHLGDRHSETLTAINNLAVQYRAAGRLDRALPLYEELLDATRERLGAHHAQTLAAVHNLAVASLVGGQKPKALELFEQFREGWKQDPSADPATLARLLLQFSRRLFLVGDAVTPRPWLEQSLQLRAEHAIGGWQTAATEALLGRSLLACGLPAEAEPLLLDGWHELDAQRAAIPAGDQVLLRDAAQALVEIYRAAGDEAKLAEWTARVDAATKGK
jgi:serine/threonine protein kinase/tetratricopeptide (TPR) repeat protein